MKVLSSISIMFFIACLFVGNANAAKAKDNRVEPPKVKAIDHNASRSNTTSQLVAPANPNSSNNDNGTRSNIASRSSSSTTQNSGGANINKNKLRKKSVKKNHNCKSNNKDCLKK